MSSSQTREVLHPARVDTRDRIAPPRLDRRGSRVPRAAALERHRLHRLAAPLGAGRARRGGLQAQPGRREAAARVPRGQAPRLRAAARPARHRVPARGVARAVRDPVRRDDLVRGAGAARRPPERAARGRRRERREPDRDHRAVPPRREPRTASSAATAAGSRSRSGCSRSSTRSRARAICCDAHRRAIDLLVLSLIATLVAIAFVAIPIVIVVKIVRRLQQMSRGISDPRVSSACSRNPPPLRCAARAPIPRRSRSSRC